MSGRETEIPSQTGHNYQGVHVYGKAHLGNTYYSRRDSALNRLPYAVEAPFNSYTRQPKPTCLDNTRIDVRQKIFDWADGQDERCIFWVNGLAGTGKSTIARTVARKYYEQKRLGASFFSSRGGGDVSHAGKFFTSIAVQLANNAPPLQRYICEAITERSDIAAQSLHDQWRQLVFGPLSKLNGNSCLPSYILVVDALDECDSDNNIKIILQFLAEARSLQIVRLRVFITSRPEVPIRHGLCQITEAERQDFIFHGVSRAIMDQDIFIFLEHNLKMIRQESHLASDWPGERDLRRLVEHANGLFIWAATACQFIREGRRFAADRLSMLLKDDFSVGDSVDDSSMDDSSTCGSPTDDATVAPEEQLNKIYITVLKNSVRNYTRQERKKWFKLLRETTGSIILLFSPLSALPLAVLLDVRGEDIIRTLDDLHSILDIPQDQARPIRLHHPSFRDFLLSKDRCGHENFWVDEKQAHRTLADSCIRLMSASLHVDICGVGAPGVLVTDIKSNRVKQCLPPEVQYACLYWVQHFQKSGDKLHDDDQVQKFLHVYLLYWLEAMSWMRKISEGILAISSLESLGLTSNCPLSYAFIHDMKRFALHFRSAIEQTPLQIYCSALVFAPEKSLVRKQFEDRVPRWIQRSPVVEKDWSAVLQALEGHSDWVRAVAFSPDGKQLASGSDDRTVRLWDSVTGAPLQTLEGHSGRVYTVAFSPDGKQLASGSGDSTVRLWDTATGAPLQTPEGHSGSVRALAFSPDGKQLASGSDDSTVRLWDSATGAPLQVLEVDAVVRALSFSSDGACLETDRGLLDITSLSPGTVPFRPNSSGGMFVKEQWVARGMENLLWLPSDYRPRCVAVRGSVVILGQASGRLSILEFRF